MDFLVPAGRCRQVTPTEPQTLPSEFSQLQLSSYRLALCSQRIIASHNKPQKKNRDPEILVAGLAQSV